MEILFSSCVLVVMYLLLFVSKKRRLRAADRARRLSWDKSVDRLYGRWHFY